MGLTKRIRSLKHQLESFSKGHSRVEILLFPPGQPSTISPATPMAQFPVVTDQRKSARVPLTLPVRLRWQGALGQTLEVTETLDSSRGGLLFFRTSALSVNARLWVTFPYSAESVEAQPEVPARVVRIKTTPGRGQLVAIEFLPLPRPEASAAVFNRRGTQRLPLALPMTVRFHEVPWPEHAMSRDISSYGVLFRTARQYSVGDVVCVSIPHGIWARRGEMEAHVVRVDSLSGSVEHGIALSLTSKNC